MASRAGRLIDLGAQGVHAPVPFFCDGRPAQAFAALRRRAQVATGGDFLGVIGDMYREPTFVSAKPGVAHRSWHKTGRAFDYNQADERLVVVREDRGNGLVFFRTFLRSESGLRLRVTDYRGLRCDGFLWDFTQAAESHGFERVPAHRGWTTQGPGYNLMEFWHYQITEGLTWAAAMAHLYALPVTGDPAAAIERQVYGLNDRGPQVRRVQQQLVALGLLHGEVLDGVFGPRTRAAVELFQSTHNLKADGLAGPRTRAVLDEAAELPSRLRSRQA